jgi:hypothetical protein
VRGLDLGQPFSEGGSFQSVVPGTPPGANTNFVLTLDSRWVWRIIGCVFTLTTDANVANRYVTLEYAQNDGVSNTVNAAGVLVLAGSTQRFAGSMYRGVAEWNTGSDVLFPLLPVWLYGGSTVSILVANKQVGDTLTVIRFVVDRVPSDVFNRPAEYV